jgi:hypothetical protein
MLGVDIVDGLVIDIFVVITKVLRIVWLNKSPISRFIKPRKKPAIRVFLPPIKR